MAYDSLAEQFGRVLGEVGIEEHSLVSFLRRYSIYTHDRVKAQERTFVIGGTRIRCVDLEDIDAAGVARTGINGRTTWRLSEYICKGGNQFFEAPVCFLVTPYSDSPVYVTTRPTLPHPPDDVVVEVSSWNPGGYPAPNVTFAWQCRVLTFFAAV